MHFLVFYLVGAVLIPNLLSIGYSAYIRFWNQQAISPIRFLSDSMKDLRVIDDEKTYGQVRYVKKINEGLEILRFAGLPEGKIFVFDFTNPFSFALLRPSPKGDLAVWHKGFTFTEEMHPSPEKALSDASIIMWSADPEMVETRTAMTSIYREEMKKHFMPLASSKLWYVLQRAPDDAIRNWRYEF